MTISRAAAGTAVLLMSTAASSNDTVAMSIFGSLAPTFTAADSTQAAVDRTAAGAYQGQRFGSQVQDGQSYDDGASFVGIRVATGAFTLVYERDAFSDRNEGRRSLSGSRTAHLEIEGSAGMLTLGRSRSLYAVPLMDSDAFYDISSTNFVGGFSNEGGSYGVSNLANGWTDGAIQYTTPAYYSLSFDLGMYFQELNDEDADYYAGLNYEYGPLRLDIGHLASGADLADGAVAGTGQVVKDSTQAVLQLAFPTLEISASYEDIGLRQIDEQRRYGKITARFFPQSRWGFDVSAGSVDQGAGEGQGFSAGFRGSFNTRASWRLSYSYADLENNTESSIVGLQFRFNFDESVALELPSKDPLAPPS